MKDCIVLSGLKKIYEPTAYWHLTKPTRGIEKVCGRLAKKTKLFYSILQILEKRRHLGKASFTPQQCDTAVCCCCVPEHSLSLFASHLLSSTGILSVFFNQQIKIITSRFIEKSQLPHCLPFMYCLIVLTKGSFILLETP